MSIDSRLDRTRTPVVPESRERAVNYCFQRRHPSPGVRHTPALADRVGERFVLLAARRSTDYLRIR